MQALLRGQVTDIMAGSVFLFIGLAACAIAAMHRRRGTRIFAWLGIWSGLYGAMQLSHLEAVVAALPGGFRTAVPFLRTAMLYVLIVFALLSFYELSLGRLRVLLRAAMWTGLAVAAGGLGRFVVTGSDGRWPLYNNLLAAGLLGVLSTVVALPGLSRKYLALPNRGVLAAGMLVFAVEALYNSLSRPLGFGTPRILDHLGFGVLLFSFGYAALQLVLGNERRLLAVEEELRIARQIQTAILPAGAPELEGALIHAVYRPMSEVAGDFYEFLPVDRKRAGLLVADVCGHGVPAALIASMVKVAVQTVSGRASDPGAVLRGLNRVLSGQLRGRLVSAAYLWLDMEDGKALYSGAGHPPLLRWRQGKLDAIESNGLLFGVSPEYDGYPVCSIPLAAGDRFLLATDGVTEPENAGGEPFGERRLEEVVRGSQACPPSELSETVLSEIRRWQPASKPQQDDITLILIDVV